MKAILQKNAFLKFLIYSGATYVLLYLIHTFLVKRFTYYDQSFIQNIIHSAQWVLECIGYKTFAFIQERDFQVVGIDGSTGVWVGSNCNAISLFMLFVVFVLWYPGHQKAKLWFIPFGLITIHILNILRVVALALIAFYKPGALDFNHTYTFTFLVYGYIFFLWMWWVNKYAGKKTQVQ
jgi:exosortase family protein XrtF